MASRIVTFNAITTSPTVRLKPLVMMMSLALGTAFNMQALAAEVSTERVSTSSAGAQGNSFSHESHLSADGTRVVFWSRATNLVAGDTDGGDDIFVKDLTTGAITRVNVDNTGVQANDASYEPSISADGSKVAFQSYATNLVTGDTDSHGYPDIFVKDLTTGEITQVSVDSAGAQGNSFSSDPSLSADGSKVVFGSVASNLVTGDTNGWNDIFVKDLTTGEITRASVNSAGGQGNNLSSSPSLSADGSKVAFESGASNLVAGDTNGYTDIFVKDLTTGEITRVSVNSAGAQGDYSSAAPSVSADGSKVAFYSRASNLVAGDTNGLGDIFVKDLTTGEITRVSVNSASQQAPSLSADGTRVAFNSSATGDTNGYSDIFVKDLTTGEITRVSVNRTGAQGNGGSGSPSLSADGSKVAFDSAATNLVARDTNDVVDIFVSTLPMPNLSVMAGPQSPNCSATTCTLTLPFTVVNSGTIDIDTTGLSAYAYLSADAQCGTVDAYKGTTSITTSPALMAAGASSPLWSFTLTGKVTEFRNKYACVLIDGDNKLDESDEIDNWASWRIKLR